ncbi:MAG: serine/threonine-protein kinase [bacterium]|nr:serine/threonine-protein kinase [bacterium]
MDNEILVGKQIDDYLITDHIKAGGVAVVYKAKKVGESDTLPPVAIKVLQISWAEHEEVVYRFLREGRIMQKLQHPNIIPLYDFGMYQRRPYIVMEYLAGGSLADRLKQERGMSLRVSAHILNQVADALDFAHSKQVIHRDLKPGNILLGDGSDAFAMLTDFGIARVLEHTVLTQGGVMPGTPHYMSPEQARGAEQLSRSSDLYSFGVIAYLMAVGRLPFGGEPLVIINQHLTATPPTPSSLNPDLPRALDPVLLKMLEKDPKNRYITARAFADAFASAITGHEGTVVKLNMRKIDDNGGGSPPSKDAQNPIARMQSEKGQDNRFLWVLIAGLAVALVVIGVLLVLSR